MSKFNFLTVLQKVEQTKRVLPEQLANMTQNYFAQSFRVQGIGGVKWKEVKRRIQGTPEYKYPKKKGLSRRTKPILIMTGQLRRDTANSVMVADWNKIRLIVAASYSGFVNKDRPFVKQTQQLTDMQVKKIESFFDKVWKK